jgi:hypothetical protein
MKLKSRSIALVLFLAGFFLSSTGSLLFAQAPIPTPQELDQLLAPVALYPDSLLAQITTASTNPQEILDVSNWLQQNPGLQGAALTDAAEKQGFDSAFVALVMFPDVINMMAEDVDDFAAIGEAFTADQGAVSASIQRLRAQAYAAGTLQSNQQQTVEVQQAAQPVYVIQPANPQVVYVPIYNPTTVYYRSPTPVYVTYGPPISINILVVSTRPWGWGGWGWNWSSHRAYYNHAVWVGWRAPYRPPNYWYRPRPIPYNARPGYGGKWNYRPPNYRPPTPRPLPANRPAWSPNNRPGNQGPGNRPGNGRPPVQQPKPGGKPGQPTTKPGGTRPGENPPGQTRPTPPNGNRPPVTKPVPQPKPGTRPTQPTTRPAPQPSTRPTQPTTRPAPQPNTRPTQPTTRPAPQPSPRPTQPATRPAPQPSPRPTQPTTRPAPRPSPRPTQPTTRPAQPNTKQAKPNTKPPQGKNSGSRPPAPKNQN